MSAAPRESSPWRTAGFEEGRRNPEGEVRPPAELLHGSRDRREWNEGWLAGRNYERARRERERQRA